MKNIKNILFSASLALTLAGCSDGGSNNNVPAAGGNSGQYDVNELGYNPQSRWPEKGSYSYNYDYTYNGANCKTAKNFPSKAEYCMGLQDQNLNNSCALSIRKNQYTQACGNDFQEINFTLSFGRSGFDDRLQRSCSTGRPASNIFRTTKNYCVFLKDEALHQNCFWDARFEDYKALHCEGLFSAEPPLRLPPVESPRETTPPPTRSTPPAPAPQDPAVVQYLKSQGIAVTVNWDALNIPRRLPGTLPAEQQLEIFWQELEANKEEIILRRHLISEINVTLYTTYRPNDKTLFLDFETKPGSLSEYFPLFDKILLYAQDLAINFDFIHGTNFRITPFLALKSVLAAIENNWQDLENMKGVFKKIELASSSSYYSPSQFLRLDEDHIDSELKKWISLLKPLAFLYSWAFQNQINIDAYFEVENQINDVNTAFKVLKSAMPVLNKMAHAQMLKDIKFYFIDNGEVNYYQSFGKLSLSLGPVSEKSLLERLNYLGDIAGKSLEIQRTILIYTNTINDSFAKSVAVLEKFWPKIKAKASRIKSLKLGYSTSYNSRSQELTVGADSSDKDTEEVISKI